ncbi:fimbrial protein [Cupriavidus sp. CV2]|uniref:fimbrial protein n=1 Tax=Cupriavidus ulmosensis TaxID=3065913 RepID=UPI00296B3F5B|nr:fimbrial protein [Cupriavidus sp. CV2]MDW3684328.1 fimbrial protein [Cupriavidus sp. CV2]
MKRTIFSSLAAACVAMAAMAPTLSHAFDGQLDFTGSITDVSCTINGKPAGPGNRTTVDLGRVDPAVFTAVGVKSPAVPFSLVMGGGSTCKDGSKASISFDSGSANIDPVTGNLVLQGNASAQGVQIEVSDNGNGATGKIALNQAQATPQVATIAANTATLTYSAAYVQTAATVNPGAANSFIRYTMAYY